MSSIPHLAVMRNAFSSATTAAKIPDGSCALSVASRYSISQQLTSTAGEFYVCLYPGFFSGLSTISSTSSLSNPADIPPFYHVFNVTNRTPDVGAAAVGAAMTLGPNFPSQWRVVSQGLRLSLINNSSDNDGWFEAIRINPAYNPDEFVRTPLGYFINPVTINHGAMTVLDAAANQPRIHPDWSMNPTYIAGKLRDISKHTFLLHREDESTYIEVKDTNIIPFEVQSTSDQWFNDSRVDCILIRCRANALTADGNRATNLIIHAHMVQNVEETYVEPHILARFQTKCPVDRRGLFATLASIRSDYKPSVLRIPTSGQSVYNTATKSKGAPHKTRARAPVRRRQTPARTTRNRR